MKKIFIICCSFGTYLCAAQTSRVVKKSAPKERKTRYSYENQKDSAHIYFMSGWDSYKANDTSTARLCWERGANCKSKIPSKYSSAFRYGLMLQNGEGIEANQDDAFFYYKLASANGLKVGDVDATKNIASYYENGMSVKQDYRKALEWYLKAKLQGNKYCDADIARIRQKLIKKK